MRTVRKISQGFKRLFFLLLIGYGVMLLAVLVFQRRLLYLPTRIPPVLLFDRYNPAECLKSYAGPVLVAVAGQDEIIGADSGRRLFASYGGPKRLVEFPGAGHNDVAAQSPEWWGTVFVFWRQPAKR